MPAPTDAELRTHLHQRLPDYMIPQAFVRLPVMPLTPSGKIDRRALPAPTMDDVVGGDEFVEPRTESELMVAALWAEALGVRRLGATDNFFALGGHSLLASQVLARLRRDHGIEHSFRKIFEAPTVEQFASVIDASLASDAPSEGGALSPIVHREDDGPAPLSWLQERFWMLEQLDQEHQLVHRSPASWRLLGRLDADLLEECVRELVRRHAAMRTSIRVTDGVPSQVVAADVPFVLERLDLSHVPEDRRRAEFVERCNERTLTPFDLASAPLFRAMLVRFSDDEHVLYTLQHTIVWDGWSFDRFITELCEIYAARSEGRVPELPELPRTYADFAAWQREWTQGADAAPHIAWWRERLADAPAPLELPGDRPRPLQPTFRGGAESVALSRAEVDALTELARANDATLAMLLLTAYNVLLYRYTDCTDLVVGSPVRARSHTEIEHVLGPFVNTIALRTVIEPERSFAELLRRVRDDSLDAFSHQELPLERLDDAAPVLRASFSMQDARTRPTRMGALDVQQYHLPQIAAGSDLMLWTMLTAEGLIAVANYATDLFDASTARRLVHHFRTLLMSVLQDVHQPISRIAIMPEEERADVAAAVSAPERTWRPVSDMFEEQATRSPGTPAVVSGDSAVSYTALRDQAAALAASLGAGGATAGTRVPIVVRDGALRAASLLGVMQSGATAILVDPDDPPAYVLSLLRAAGARLVVADDDLAPDVAAALPHLSVVRVPAATEAAGATDAPADRPQRESAVDIQWAGGDAGATTAPVSDGALATLLDDLRTQVGVGPEDVVASVLPPSHDAAALEILLPLISGATLVVIPRESVGDGEALSDALRDCGATVVVAPTEVCVSLEEAGWRGGASFRAIVPGGAVAARAIRPLAGRVGRLFVAHGHPRAGAWFSLNEVSAEGEATVIGTPAGMSRLLVLDRTMQPAPTGVWGELCVAGPAVDARGAELNGAADDTFVRNPFGGAHEWLFRTGDRARRRADGRFEYGGGTDDAGWLFGARVELAAIDRALQAHPAVESAAAVLDGARDGVPRVVAHVVSAGGEPVPEREVRSAVRQVLPARMVPRLIVEVETLPTDGAGHVDRARLLQALSGAAAALEFVPPRTETETLLAQLWLDVLNVDRVGVHDNFFNLGGNSLSCFQVVGRLASNTGVRLSPRVLLLNTLGQAAVEIERALPAASASTPSAEAPAPNGALFGRLKRFVTRST
jgi:non-ribosomal peptide synthetase component F